MPASDLPSRIEAALHEVHDEASFIQHLLVDTLDWPFDPGIREVEDIAYQWTQDELKADGLDRHIADGTVRQLAMPGCPWGVFLLDFKHPDVFTAARGMTAPLRAVLRGLVHNKRKSPRLPSFQRDHLLFICTHNYTHFRFAFFKDPGEGLTTPPLASFGWHPGDSTKTVCQYNLPHLAFLDPDAIVDDWLSAWASAFDVERVTKKFFGEYQTLHDTFRDALAGVESQSDRKHLASVLLNRLMFVYFLQKKGFLDRGDQQYLEHKLAAHAKAHGRDRFYTGFLTPLFFDGFAKPARRATPAR